MRWFFLILEINPSKYFNVLNENILSLGRI